MTGPSITCRAAPASPPPDRALQGRGRPLYLELARFFLAIVFLVTAIGKLLDNRGFAEVLVTFKVLPDSVMLPLALAISLAELGLSLWLFSGIRLRLAAGATLAFNCAYVAWLGLALWRGLDIANCGCFGVFWARPLTPYTLLEDGVLILASIILFIGLAERGREEG